MSTVELVHIEKSELADLLYQVARKAAGKMRCAVALNTGRG